MKILVPLVFIFLSLTATNGSAVSRQFDSIYQFGDGFSDTGNLMIESPTYATRCSYRPYGMSISDHPSGRCSDGLLIIDYFARSFNLPSPFPYLGLQSPFADLEHGLNFAMDGGTALDTQPDYLRKSLNYQLSWFKDSLNCTNSTHDPQCKNKLSKALFVIGEIGANDYKDSKLPMQEVFDNLIPQVVASVINAAKVVIDHGGVNLIVPGIYPLGCTPDVIYHYNFGTHETSTSRDSFGCLNQFNDISKVHNEQLKQGLKELQKQHPNVEIHYGDYYSAFSWVLENAESLGFEGDDVVTEKCCDYPCGFDDTKVCKDPRKMISWDGTHLTQQVYQHMAQWLLQDVFSATSPPSASPASPMTSSFSRPMMSASPSSPVTSSFSTPSPSPSPSPSRWYHFNGVN